MVVEDLRKALEGVPGDVPVKVTMYSNRFGVELCSDRCSDPVRVHYDEGSDSDAGPSFEIYSDGEEP